MTGEDGCELSLESVEPTPDNELEDNVRPCAGLGAVDVRLVGLAVDGRADVAEDSDVSCWCDGLPGAVVGRTRKDGFLRLVGLSPPVK